MVRWGLIVLASVALMVPAVAVAEDAAPKGRITGVGGVFVRSPDPKAPWESPSRTGAALR